MRFAAGRFQSIIAAVRRSCRSNRKPNRFYNNIWPCIYHDKTIDGQVSLSNYYQLSQPVGETDKTHSFTKYSRAPARVLPMGPGIIVYSNFQKKKKNEFSIFQWITVNCNRGYVWSYCINKKKKPRNPPAPSMYHVN